MSSIISLGSRGDEVKLWQRVVGVAEDGDFGRDTHAATLVLQSRLGLAPTGQVDDGLWWASGARPPDRLAIVRGIDVSAIQGILTETDWQAIAAAGARFAWLRGVVGNEYRDTQLLTNVERAKRVGIKPGAYVFPFPLPHLDPKQQAEFFVKLLGTLGSAAGELPIAFDLEWPPPEEKDKATGQIVDTWKKWRCNPQQLRDWALACLERGEELTGHTWAIYTYRYWAMRAELDKSPELAERPLWLADYTFKGRVPTPLEAHLHKSLKPWKRIAAIQHDGDGGLHLPNGRDADFNVFLGDELDIERFCGVESVPVIPAADIAAASVRQSTLGLITEDLIASYRRERIDIDADAA